MRKMSNRLSVLLFVFALTIAGCTPAGESTTTADSSATTGPDSTTVAETTTTTSGGEEPVARDSITIVVPEEPLALDPLLPNSDILPVTFNLFEPLISLTNEGEVVPQLALVFEQVEPTRWHLELRPDVTFHDGSPFNADVVEHMVIDLQDILVSNGLPFEGMTVEKIDDLTIDVITVQPDPLTARLFTLVGVPPIGGPPDPIAPNGTGPYRLVEWVPGVSITVDAVADHWSGITPEVQHATYLFRSEGSVRAGMVQNGEADIAAALPAQNAADIPSTPVIQTETAYFELDSFTPPLDDLRVREAINLALDRETIVETLFGGFATPATQLYPPGAFGTSPNIEPWPYDPERAAELIAEAAADGVPTDTELLFVGRIGIYPNSTEVVTTVAEALRGIGLNVRVQMLEVSAWLEEIALDLGSRILQLQHGNATFDVGQGIPNVICPSGSLSKYEDADLQVLCDAVTAASVDDREAAMRAVIEYHHDVLKDPGVPLAHPHMIFGHSDAITISPSYLGLVPLQSVTFR